MFRFYHQFFFNEPKIFLVHIFGWFSESGERVKEGMVYALSDTKTILHDKGEKKFDRIARSSLYSHSSAGPNLLSIPFE